MHKGLTSSLLFASFLFVHPFSADADLVKLKSGQVHKGAVTAEEEDRVQLKLEGSGVRIWFQKDQIAALERDSKKADDPPKEDPQSEQEPNTEGLSEDVVRARELLEKLRAQPELATTNRNKPRSEKNSVSPEDAAPLAPAGNDAEIEKLIDQLRNGKYYDQLSACKKLGDLGAEAAIPHLIHYLDDENFTIRQESNRSLIKITGNDFGFDPKANRNVRLWTIDKWKQWYEEEKTKNAGFNLKWFR
ncbi:MAG: HEAT repeat domain-containing protein [Candidatus Abyssobacteria bacterium SURF_5]|uniref:HEAT repeat domain-containing protein n=1 Tax=Abyssobacteria bacterium (strain SURF_5) TaxID=2093360 RepID=A0A3A4NVV5_ABYX5|nr:MAG: HEAT repeat domain-containing protein [Candidatus Abyssubacteria bacterium SURF_5]